jgi:hypothetical protein
MPRYNYSQGGNPRVVVESWKWPWEDDDCTAYSPNNNFYVDHCHSIDFDDYRTTASGKSGDKRQFGPGANVTGCTFYSEPGYNCVAGPGNKCKRGPECKVPDRGD